MFSCSLRIVKKVTIVNRSTSCESNVVSITTKLTIPALVITNITLI